MIIIEYNRSAAIDYAEQWALKRNPQFYSFNAIGGNCTNFVSQCIYAGCGVMNFTPVTGWYYIDANDRSASWTGVKFFHRFMTNNLSDGPFGVDTNRNNVLPGDVIQLGHNSGEFYHSLIVLSVSPDEIAVAANSNDALYRPLSSYTFDRIRYIHIIAARKN